MIVKDFYFKTQQRGSMVRDSYTGLEFSDLEDFQPHIRIVGTEEEIDFLSTIYIEKNNLLYYLDEVYMYEVPKKGTYWYKHCCYGSAKEYKGKMKKISLNLKKYKKKYKQEGAFII